MNENKLNPAKIILVLIVLLSFGTVMGVIGFSLSLKNSPPVAVQPTPTLKPTITPTPTPSDETADWKTYRNKKYGFEFKYPNDWFIKSESATNVMIVNNRYKNAEGEFPYISISVYNNKKDLALRNWFYNNQSQFFGDIKPKEGEDYKLKDIMVENYNAIEFSYSRIIKDTLIDFNSNIVSVSAINAIESYDQILSTFKSTGN